MDRADAEKARKLWDLIRGIRVAMLTSEDGPYLRSRPMTAIQTEFEGTLWFFTHASSHKRLEIQSSERVCVSYADPEKQDYVSMSGHARLVRDPEQIQTRWTEAARIWFPRGTSDPDIALLKVEVERAEYWDAPSSAMVQAYGYAKAVVTGKSPDPGDNEKLSFE
jgi:general stress protein 26